jgi:hypothetical protein
MNEQSFEDEKKRKTHKKKTEIRIGTKSYKICHTEGRLGINVPLGIWELPPIVLDISLSYLWHRGNGKHPDMLNVYKISKS